MTALGAQTVSFSLSLFLCSANHTERKDPRADCVWALSRRKKEEGDTISIHFTASSIKSLSKKMKNAFPEAHGLEQQPNKVLKKRYWPNL